MNTCFQQKQNISGAQDALLRLQETFDLTSKQIVEGIVDDSSSPKLGKLALHRGISISTALEI